MNLRNHIKEWGAGITNDIKGITEWEKRNFASNSLFLIMAAVVGLTTGTCAWFLKLLIRKLTHLFTSGMSPLDFNYRLLLLPMLGILFTGIFSRYIAKTDVSHGVAHINKDLNVKRYKYSLKVIWANIFGNTLTLGFGGSAGSEGPIAYTGAAIGSNVGRFFNMSDDVLRVLIGIGAGAGIAGIFKSPVGGVLFTLEVLEIQMSAFNVLALFVACIVSSLTCFGFSNFRPDVLFIDVSPFDPTYLGWTIVLGVVCGLYSVYYNTIKQRLDIFFNGIRNPWIKNILAGLSLSVFIFFFPAFYGEGYGIATDLINDKFIPLVEYSIFGQYIDHVWLLPVCALAIILLKSLLVSASTSGGGIAGDFAPTLFAGAVTGFLFGYVINEICGTDLPACNFALAGMAAVMSATIHAPLMSIFLVVEMSQGYTFFLPVSVAAAVAYITMKLITPDSKFREARHDDILSLRKKH